MTEEDLPRHSYKSNDKAYCQGPTITNILLDKAFHWNLKIKHK